jgi:hypothetical protein
VATRIGARGPVGHGDRVTFAIGGPVLPSPIVLNPPTSALIPSRRPAMLLAALILLAIAILPATEYVGDRRSADAMLAAPACPGEIAGPDCRLLVIATVAGVHENRKPSYTEIRIDAPAQAAGSFRFDSGSDIVTGLSAGSTVTAEIWRGHVVRLTDDGGQAYTAQAPTAYAYRELALAICAVAVALALLAKYALRRKAFVYVPWSRKPQWVIDYRDAGSIAYTATLIMAAAASVGTFITLQIDGGGIDPLPWMAILGLVITIPPVLNTVFVNRRSTAAHGYPFGHTRVGYQRLNRAYALLIIGTLAAIATGWLAITDVDQIADEYRMRQAPACAPGVTRDCLRHEQVVPYADPSGSPAIYVWNSSAPPQWVSFHSDQQAFVASTANTDVAIVTLYDDTIVAMSDADYPTTYADTTDGIPLYVIEIAALVTGLLLAAAITMGWQRPAWWRVAAALAIGVVATIGVRDGLRWSPYALIPAYALLLWPRRSVVDRDPQ